MRDKKKWCRMVQPGQYTQDLIFMTFVSYGLANTLCVSLLLFSQVPWLSRGGGAPLHGLPGGEETDPDHVLSCLPQESVSEPHFSCSLSSISQTGSYSLSSVFEDNCLIYKEISSREDSTLDNKKS